MSVNINTQTTKVPANFELPVSITGNFVLNKSSSGGLKLRFPNGALVDFNEGDKYRLEAGTQFGNIHLVNESRRRHWKLWSNNGWHVFCRGYRGKRIADRLDNSKQRNSSNLHWQH